MDAKHLRCKDFAGDLVEFDEWAYVFKRGIRFMYIMAYELLVKAERMEVVDVANTTPSEKKYLAEIYDLLCQNLTGSSGQRTSCKGYQCGTNCIPSTVRAQWRGPSAWCRR